MATREQNLKRLYEIIFAIYTQDKFSRPDIAAQFHVEGFVAQNRHATSSNFDKLLEMEIEDCSRALVAG